MVGQILTNPRPYIAGDFFKVSCYNLSMSEEAPTTSWWKIILGAVMLALVFGVSFVGLRYFLGDKFFPNSATLDTSSDFGFISKGQKEIRVEVVATEAERLKGLGGRDEIPQDFGMLFIFQESDYQGIWMKEMRFPLDIIWLNDSLEIVDIKEAVEPKTYPDVFFPHRESIYVLELNAGMAKKNKLEVGDKVYFSKEAKIMQ